ncbi:hypothetical protein V8F20_012240 [Naviculisporaceae sp. PSN 640]
MPSFHLKKQLNKLRSGSSKSSHLEDNAATDSSVKGKATQSGDDKVPSVTDPTHLTSSKIIPSLSGSPLPQKPQPVVTDPLGLTLVYSPDDGTVKADIVFIHGLGGTSRMTWSKDRDIRLFWPGVFLPLENELSQTRIFTFGYNADVKSGIRTTSSILTFAKDLLYDLNYALVDETKGLRIGQVPLVFVAHSMGGLVVKEAYIQGQHDPDYVHIIKSVLAILFLSTPHRGTNLAETLSRILQVSPISTPKPYIHELVQNSLTIQRINEQFRHLAPKLNIISFYETSPTAIVRGASRIMVLEKDSSVLGYPGEVSKALDADHHTVCKYDSREDPKYLAVCNYLKAKISTIGCPQTKHRAVNLSISSSQTASTVPTPKSHDFLDIFDISEPFDTDFVFFRDRWTEGTCHWVLSEPSFTKWLDDHSQPSTSSLLWIHGLPGSGKSVLSSYLVDYMAHHGHSCQYFFIRQADSRKRSLSSLLRSIAFQITQSDPSFLQALAKVSDNLTLRGADARTIWQRVFKSVLFTCIRARSDPLFWILDGFDECDDVRSGIKLLTEVLAFPLPIKILVTSRQNSEIEMALKRASLVHGKAVDTMTMQGNVEDCERLIKAELDWTHIPDFQQRISKRLLQQAEGSFLWIKLTVDRINRCHTAAAVEQALQALHPGMEQLYHQMATSISDLSPADASLATDILMWVCCAQRRLTVLELAMALEPRNHGILDLQRSLVGLCSGFVILDNEGYVSMVHQTARDFLVKSKDDTFHVNREEAHATIALRCLRLLITPGLRRKIKLGQAPVLLPYATQYLWAHIASCNPLADNIIQGFTKFLKGQDVFTWIQVLAQDGQLHVMVQASDYMSICAGKFDTTELGSNMELLNSWATDLGKLVGKFGRQLLNHPDSIHTTIAPFCPISSKIHQQLAHQAHQIVKVSGIGQDWDDSVARLSFPSGYDALTMVSSGPIVAVSGTLDNTGRIIIYRVDTNEEIQQLEHGERLRRIELDQFGTMLVSCGYLTTLIWNLETGECCSQARNPPTKPYPQTLVFDRDNSTVLIGTNDRRLWSIPVLPIGHTEEVETKYTQVTRITERNGGTNSPTCMALSPDKQLLACGYRQPGVGLTVWELESQELIACRHDLTRATQLVWHPHNGELFGLLQILGGKIFKWYPDEYQEPIMRYSEASSLAISDNGSVLAVGDQHGTVRLMSTDDLTVICHVVGQSPVLGLAFSSDCRRLYDLRRTHVNVWQPNILLQLAEPIPELNDFRDNSDRTLMPNREASTASPLPFNTSRPTEIPRSPSRVDPITAFSPRPIGTAYCIGTLAGVVALYDASSPSRVLLELYRSKNFFSIQQIAWSSDGSRICYADVSRTIRVHTFSLADGSPSAIRLAKVSFHELKDNVTQVLFHPSDIDRLLVASSATAVLINISENRSESATSSPEVLVTRVTADMTGRVSRWISHPWSDRYVLKISEDVLEVFSWDSLESISSTDLRQSTKQQATSGGPGAGDPSPISPPSVNTVDPLPGSIKRSHTTSHSTSAFRIPLDVFISPPSESSDENGKHAFYLLTCNYTSNSPRSLSLGLWKLQASNHSDFGTIEVTTANFQQHMDPHESPASVPEAGISKDDQITAIKLSLPAHITTSIARPLGFVSSGAVGNKQKANAIHLVFMDRTSSVSTWQIPVRDETTSSGSSRLNTRTPVTPLAGQRPSGSVTESILGSASSGSISTNSSWKGKERDLSPHQGPTLGLSHRRRNLPSNQDHSRFNSIPTMLAKGNNANNVDNGKKHAGAIASDDALSTEPPRYHYSLPSDWVSLDTVALFRLFPLAPSKEANSQIVVAADRGGVKNGVDASSASDMLLACPTDGRVIIVGCNL